MKGASVRGSARAFAFLAACGLAAACGRAPAEQALKAADAALEAARPDLENYVPAELKALKDAARAAKVYLARGDYDGALASARDLTKRVAAALEAAREKKDRLTASFDRMKTSLPGTIAALARRLEALAAMPALPAGMDEATVEAAQANLEAISQAWTEAVARFEKGDVVRAVDQASQVEKRVDELAKAFPPRARAAK